MRSVATAESALMIETLHATIDILNPIGVEIVLNMMERNCGVSCSAQACSPKEEIEKALVYVFGQEAGEVVIREWNKKINASTRPT